MDKPINKILQKITFRHILIAVILILTILTRLVNLGDRVMSHDEVNHVVPSFDFYSGRGYTQSPITHGPLQFHLMALSYFLFGDNDFTSRLPHAIFSIATVAFVLKYFRRYLGKYGSIAAGIFFAISPFMMFYGRYARNEAICAFLSVAALYLILRYLEEGRSVHLFLLVISLAFNYTAKETAYIFSAQLLLFLLILSIKDFGKMQWPGKKFRNEFYIFTTAAVFIVAAALGISVLILKNANEAVLNGEIIIPNFAGQTSLSLKETLASLYPLLLKIMPATLVLFAALIILLFLREKLHWRELSTSRAFNAMLLIGTMVLPLLSAFPVIFAGITPSEYTNAMALLADYIYIVFFFGLSIVIGSIWKPKSWWKFAVVFFGIYFILFTTFLTNSGGIMTGLTGSLGHWIAQQDVARGGQPIYYFALVQIPVYEFLGAAGTILAFILGIKRKTFWEKLPKANKEAEGEVFLPIPAIFIFWSITSLIAYSLAGEKMPWLTVHIAFSMLLAAGWFVEQLLNREHDLRRIDNSRAGMPDLQKGLADKRRAGMFDIQEGEDKSRAGMPDLQENLADKRRAGMFDIQEGEDKSRAGMPDLQEDLADKRRTEMLDIQEGEDKSQAGMLDIQKDQDKRRAGMPDLQGDQDKNRARKKSITDFLFILVYVILILLVIVQLIGNHAPFQGKTTQALKDTNYFLFLIIMTGIGTYYLFFNKRKDFDPKKFKINICLALFLIMAVLTARGAFRASFINYDYPYEYLVYAHASDGPKIVLDQVEQISKRLTGGLDIKVAYDNHGLYPYWWYLRNYPNKIVYLEDPTRTLEEADLIIAGSDKYAKIDTIVRDNFYAYEYSRIWWPMQDYWNLTWQRVWDAVSDANMRQALFDIWLNRDYQQYSAVTNNQYLTLDNWLPSEKMRLYVRKDIAAQMWELSTDASIQQTVSVDPYSENMVSVDPTGSIGIGGSGGGELNTPHGIDIGPDDYLYVADSANNRIQKFDLNGNLLAAWGTYTNAQEGEAPGGTMNEPWDVAVAEDGSIYVADTFNHRIQKLTEDGEFVSMWGIFAQGNEPESFWGPRGIAIDSHGHILVTDTGNKRVMVFDEDLNFLTQFGGAGLDAGQFDEPVGIAVSDSGPDRCCRYLEQTRAGLRK